jgi:signal transduction histidine kinase
MNGERAAAPPRISLLHPDPERASAIGEALRGAGHHVRIVAPGETALEEVWAHLPDLIIAHGERPSRLRREGVPLILLGADGVGADGAELALRDSVSPEVIGSCVSGLLRVSGESRRLRRRVEDVTSLCKLSWALSLEAGPRELCGYIAKQAAAMLRADKGLVLTYDADRRWIEARSPAYGIPDDVIERLCYTVDAESAGRWHFRWNGPLLSGDAPNDPRLSSNLVAALGVRSVLIAPMVLGRSIVGLLAVAEPSEAAGFDDDDVDLLLAAGSVAARALENTALHRGVKEANETLREQDRLKSGFLGMVAHDYRRPLTAIRGFAEIVLVDDPPPETLRSYMKAIMDEAEGLSRLADDTLLVTKLETSNIEYRWSEVELAPLIRDVVPADQPRHSFVVDVPDDLPRVVVDPQRLRQVLTNLVSNAVKYSPDGGSVRLSAASGDDDVTISICDPGLGIPPDQQAGLFQRFRRVQTGKHKAVSGSGLGLYICRLIVAGHGGRIWVESEPERGSTFHVRLPRDARARSGRSTLVPGQAPEELLARAAKPGLITRMFKPAVPSGAPSTAGPVAERRHTPRIRKVLPIRISYEGVSLMTYTALVNRDGAMIVCTIPVPVGTSLQVTNLTTSETAGFEVVSSEGPEAGLHRIGIQLSVEGDFWGAAYDPPPKQSELPDPGPA